MRAAALDEKGQKIPGAVLKDTSNHALELLKIALISSKRHLWEALEQDREEGQMLVSQHRFCDLSCDVGSGILLTHQPLVLRGPSSRGSTWDQLEL